VSVAFQFRRSFAREPTALGGHAGRGIEETPGGHLAGEGVAGEEGLFRKGGRGRRAAAGTRGDRFGPHYRSFRLAFFGKGAKTEGHSVAREPFTTIQILRPGESVPSL